MASPLKKNKYYDFETKLKVILARQKGMSIKTIQKKFQIVAVQQIYRWIRWFKNKEFHRLQQKNGHNYKHKTSINLNPHNNEIKKIKQQIKTIFQLKKQNFKKACLSIIEQYKNKFSLNEIIKWLGISKNSYYRWLEQKEQPPLTNLDIKIQEICYQNRYYNNMGEGFFVWGYRRVYQELLIQNIKVNPKTVYLKMKKFNLLCQTRKNPYLKRHNNKYL